MKEILKQLAEYLFIKKRNPNEERSQFTKYMHGMNRISILMFLLVLVLMFLKVFLLPLIKK